MHQKRLVPGPAGALAAGLGTVPPFVPDIVAIKGDNREWESPQKTTSQGTKSAISNVFGAINMIERQFPRVVPPCIATTAPPARKIVGAAENGEFISQER